MFVLRRMRYVQKDATREVAEKWTAYLEKGAPHGYRVYTQGIGPRDAVVLELEFESYAEFEKTFEAVITSSFNVTDPAEREWWASVGVPGGTDEVWHVAASRK